METENTKKMPIFWLILGIAVIFLFGLVFYFFGSGGILKTILYMIIGLFILTILFLIVYAVFWLFSVHRVDTIHVNRQRILKSCLANPPKSESVLFFQGSDDWEYRKIGFITGLCRLLHKRKYVDPETKETKYDEYIEDCISFRKSLGFFSSLFTKDEIVRVLADERTNLNGERVYLKAMSFSPEKYGFFFLPNRFKGTDIKRIMSEEIHDVTMQELLKEEVNIVNDAIAISPQHQKALEKTNMQQVTETTGGK